MLGAMWFMWGLRRDGGEDSGVGNCVYHKWCLNADDMKIDTMAMMLMMRGSWMGGV